MMEKNNSFKNKNFIKQESKPQLDHSTHEFISSFTKENLATHEHDSNSQKNIEKLCVFLLKTSTPKNTIFPPKKNSPHK